ncbi:hypothetical protein FPQ18DRAFT_308730 [Pyronema domesticum]|nr:hypothetical protein FPQ18DRAFT_308730 [Pyronema domesticum]
MCTITVKTDDLKLRKIEHQNKGKHTETYLKAFNREAEKEQFEELTDKLHLTLQIIGTTSGQEQREYCQVLDETFNELKKATQGLSNSLSFRFTGHINKAKQHLEEVSEEDYKAAEQHYADWMQLNQVTNTLDAYSKLYRPSTLVKPPQILEDFEKTSRPSKTPKPEENEPGDQDKVPPETLKPPVSTKQLNMMDTSSGKFKVPQPRTLT